MSIKYPLWSGGLVFEFVSYPFRSSKAAVGLICSTPVILKPVANACLEGKASHKASSPNFGLISKLVL